MYFIPFTTQTFRYFSKDLNFNTLLFEKNVLSNKREINQCRIVLFQNVYVYRKVLVCHLLLPLRYLQYKYAPLKL